MEPVATAPVNDVLDAFDIVRRLHERCTEHRKTVRKMIGNALRPVWHDEEALAAVAHTLPRELARDVTWWIFEESALLSGRLDILHRAGLLDRACVRPSELAGFYYVGSDLVSCHGTMMEEFVALKP
jgi:hypothetical protein